MNRPSTAREALIAEAIGDLGRLLNEIESLAPAMYASRSSLVEAITKLDLRRDELKIMTEHIAQRTMALAKTTLEEQTRAMEGGARAIFEKMVGTTLLTTSLQVVIERADRHWLLLGTHALTALTSCALTLILVQYPFQR